jgi:hypothetical protein
MLAAGLLVLSMSAAAAAAPPASPTKAPAAPHQETFATPDDAAHELIGAAEPFNVEALKKILGPEGFDLVETDDPVHDKQQAEAFAAAAKEKTEVVKDKTNPAVATLIVGKDDWPAPIPIVQKNGRWLFDTKKGREEILNRRIGSNELTAISICEGYVDAQREYALDKHDGSNTNQYAQRIISTPGKQDGLAWQTADGKWEGPVGEAIARVIGEGYSPKPQPYHGYYFKVLKRQGPAAHLGAMDYVVKGVMIGGFALAAAPTDYEITGVKSFIVSNDGVVYEKDLGPKTLELFRAMDTYNPDKSWSPAPEDSDR